MGCSSPFRLYTHTPCWWSPGLLYYIVLYYIILYYIIADDLHGSKVSAESSLFTHTHTPHVGGHLVFKFLGTQEECCIFYYVILYYIMLSYIILYYIILYYIILYYIILYYIILYYIILYYIILYYVILYHIILVGQCCSKPKRTWWCFPHTPLPRTYPTIRFS
jgi:hypothetical protein